MDTKELRTLAEMLDLLAAFQIGIEEHQSAAGTHFHLVLRGPGVPDSERMERLKPILESALDYARKEVERQITKVVNAGKLTLRDTEADILHDKRIRDLLEPPFPRPRPFFGPTR